MTVDAELYDFLKQNETGLFCRKNEVIAYVHVNFCDLDDFVKMIGVDYLSEGGIEVQLMDSTVCIELNDIIEDGFEHELSDYKNCFSEYNEYFSREAG
ncbi:hypothetical protein SOV_51100 [Sporomusa ovata DSM 2662]|uniref:Uncharacterized protein n=1 Tax=Sporomusa ovata TaxID=2378 RepID=A0A0U1L0X7_9FIRM|nr:hypothetical protein [Sporomusa ovata]EQB27483.1 hypothetical protein SOV_2c03790 [Sporomusa ovata DSM 2662]CQR73326.1 hypothetical protein SpAn4DRAFT_2558 [Sporomusa ovata]